MSIAFDENDIVASICRKSLYQFVLEFWDTISAGQEYVDNWHVPYLCQQVQEEVDRVLRREPKQFDYVIVNQPPVTLKSTIFSIVLNGYVWANNPSQNFIGLSYEKELMIGHALKARDLVTSDKYQRCFPKVRLRKDMAAKGIYGTTAGGVRYSSGTRGNVTGKHGDIVVVDDPLNPKAARSAAESLAVRQCVLESLPNRKRNSNISPTFLIMQRLAQDDTTGMLLEMADQGKIRVKYICLSAEDREHIKPANLRKRYKQQGGLLFPARLPWSALNEFKASGDYFYAGQYDQLPIPVSGGMFMVDKLVRGIRPPDPNDPKKWVKQVRYWDKAAGHDEGCWTVGVRIGKDLDQHYWILHVDRFRKESYGREARIAKRARQDGKHVIQVVEQEPGSGGKDSAQGTIRNLAGFRVLANRPTGSKEERADPFAAQVNGGNVYLAPENCIETNTDTVTSKDEQGLLEGTWQRDYVDELKYAPVSKFKDQWDASAGGFNQLTKPIFRVGFGKRKDRR